MKRAAVLAPLLVTGCALVWGFDRPEPRPASDAGVDVLADAPPALPQTALWLDGALGVDVQNGLVRRWSDQSGNQNDAVQVDGGYRPVWATATGGRRAGVRFSAGTHLVIGDSATLRFGKGAFFVAVVVAYTGTPSTDELEGYSLLYSKQLVNAPYRGIGLFANYVTPTPSSTFGGQVDNATTIRTITSGLNDGNVHLFSLHRDPTAKSLAVRLNGVEEAVSFEPAVMSDVDAAGRPAYLGAQPVAGPPIQRLSGTIYEIVILAPEEVGTTGMQAVEGYLKKKYGL